MHCNFYIYVYYYCPILMYIILCRTKRINTCSWMNLFWIARLVKSHCRTVVIMLYTFWTVLVDMASNKAQKQKESQLKIEIEVTNGQLKTIIESGTERQINATLGKFRSQLNDLQSSVLETLEWTRSGPPWTRSGPPWTRSGPPWTRTGPTLKFIFKIWNLVCVPKIQV